jgi:hypothetical protein
VLFAVVDKRHCAFDDHPRAQMLINVPWPTSPALLFSGVVISEQLWAALQVPPLLLLSWTTWWTAPTAVGCSPHTTTSCQQNMLPMPKWASCTWLVQLQSRLKMVLQLLAAAVVAPMKTLWLK